MAAASNDPIAVMHFTNAANTTASLKSMATGSP